MLQVSSQEKEFVSLQFRLQDIVSDVVQVLVLVLVLILYLVAYIEAKQTLSLEARLVALESHVLEIMGGLSEAQRFVEQLHYMMDSI